MNAARLFCAFALLAALPAVAQQPDTLEHSIAPPFTALQSYVLLGSSVAVDETGGLTVAGAPDDDWGDYNAGVVKVFDTATGALLHILPNPSPVLYDAFGSSVAISGTRVVVGAYLDDTGASNAGSAYVYDLASATPTVPVVTLSNPGPFADDRFGVSVAISGTRVVVGASLDNTGASDAGSAYVYDLASGTPAVPVATLNKPGPAAGDQFGISVAISGMRVVVGCSSDDTGASGAGSASVYDLASGTPTVPVTTLHNPDPAVGDIFGYSVGISGTRVVVGAPSDDTGATNAGSAYVYDLAGATPTVPVVTLNNPDPFADDRFGVSVAISGTRVVVGAYQDDTGASSAGSAYVYNLASGTPTVPEITLGNPTPATSDNFGASVAISGTRVVVGAPNDDTSATNAGSAYSYDLAGASPATPIATLNNPGLSVRDEFGASVAVSGTLVVVLAPSDVTGATVGSVCVYDLAGATPLVPVATLRKTVQVSGDSFGYSVAISGTRVVVGNSGDDTGAVDTGGAYVYDLAGATPLVPVATLHNPEPANSDRFGSSVAISGTRIVVGAALDGLGSDNTGSAYVYDLAAATPTVPVATLRNPTPAPNDWFGFSVAISGTRVVVGAYFDSTNAAAAGSAYVYDLVSATPTVPVVTLNNPTPASSDYFGYSVAISGARVLVGAVLDDTSVADAGSAYVYDLASATPTVPVATLSNPAPVSNDSFGTSVAISGTRVVVGARLDDAGATNAGSAYIYDLASATPTVPVATLNNPSPAVGDEFGSAVSIDGTTVAIGAPWDDTVTSDKGAAYIFAPANPDFDGDGLLDIWEYARFGSISARTALDDTDKDGRNELLELAFDADTTVSDLWAEPAVTDEGGFLTLTINKRAGVSYLVETADSPDDAAFSAATTTTQINSDTTLKVRDNFTPATAPGRWIRVKVNAAP